MRHRRVAVGVLGIVAVLTPLSGVSTPVGAAGPEPGRVPPAAVDAGTVVVQAEPAAARAAAARSGLRYDHEITPGFQALTSTSPGGTSPARALGPGVQQAYHPSRAFASRNPVDPLFPAQAHLTQVRAPAAWDTSQGSDTVKIAVIDTGVAGHPDLPVVDPSDRRSFLTHPASTYDQGPTCPDGGTPASASAHGTHVAGIAAAQGGTDPAGERGGTGVVWRASLIDVRVLGPCGDGYSDDIASGITFAADRGARVINLSLAGSGDAAVLAAVRYARGRGAVVVAAAGNATCGTDGVNLAQYPAAYPEVLAVASTDIAAGDPTSCYSVGGPWVDLAAPGRDVLSTLPAGLPPGDYAAGAPREADGSGYGFISGTSMSSPEVAGAAALLFAAVPGITPGEVEARLVRSANPTAATCQNFNGGRLNVADAVADRVNAFGYRMANGRGQVAAFGDECGLGDPASAGVGLARPVVGLANTASKAGYWLVAGDGGIFSYGDAGFYGSTGGIRLDQPVVAMASTPSGRGYWLVAADGGIFSYGDAAFFGSTGGIPLNRPIVGMAPTASGRGYWLVASDGGIFTFGDAAFLGSTGSVALNQPVLAMQPTRTGRGYWMVAADGGIFTFGDARFLGSTGNVSLNRPIVGMAAAPDGGGYWLVASDGGVFAFGDAPFLGSGFGRLTDVVSAGG